MSAISGKCSGERKHLETGCGGGGGGELGSAGKCLPNECAISFPQTHPRRELLKSSTEKKSKAFSG